MSEDDMRDDGTEVRDLTDEEWALIEATEVHDEVEADMVSGPEGIVPDPDFAWLEAIVMADHAAGDVVQAGGVTVVVRKREAAAVRIARDG